MGPRTSNCSRMQLGLAFVGGKGMLYSYPGVGHVPRALWGPLYSELLWGSSCSCKDSVST